MHDMPSLLQWLAAHPYLLLFALVLAGSLLGRASMGGYALGAPSATLAAGVLIAALGAMHGLRFALDPGLREVFLCFFAYALALRIGPSFALAFRGEGLRYGLLAVIAAAVALVCAVVLVNLWDLPAATAGGILAGATTATVALAAAEQALHQGAFALAKGHSADDASALLFLAYAVNYVFATLGILLVCRYLPRWWGLDVQAEARREEERIGVPNVDDSGLTGYRPLAVRAYRVVNGAYAGSSLAQIRQRHPALRVLNVLRIAPPRLAEDAATEAPAAIPVEAMALAAAGVQSITLLRETDPSGYSRPNAALSDTRYARLGASDDLEVRAGDIVTVGAQPADIASLGAAIGPEVADPTAVNIPLDHAEIHVTRPEVVGRELGELRNGDFAGEVALHHIERGGVPVPLGLHVRLQRFDVVHVSGVKGGVEKLAQLAGRVARPGTCADLFIVSFGMVLGLALGAVSIPAGGIRVGLGTVGGVVVAGLAVSAFAPPARFGPPTVGAARNLLEDLGLVMFVAAVALQAGGALVTHGSAELVAKIFIAGLVTGTLPLLVAWTVGLHAMKMNPAVLVGALAGARSHTAPARDAARETGSSAPWIGFPAAYAAATVLLGLAGYAAMAAAG